MAELSTLRAYARWLRHEARLESIWILNLTRNHAPDWLIDEHAGRQAGLERKAAAAEATIAELERP